MIVILLLLLLTVSQKVYADDKVQWGDPHGGLRLGIRYHAYSIPIDDYKEPFFTVLIQNISNKPIALPALGSLIHVRDQPSSHYESPLKPIITFANNYFSVSGNNDKALLLRDVKNSTTTLLPDGVMEWKNMALQWHACDDPAAVLLMFYVLTPDHFLCYFSFRNQDPIINRTPVWSGEIMSPKVPMVILTQSFEGVTLEPEFTLPKKTYEAGEPIIATFKMKNTGKLCGFFWEQQYNQQEQTNRFNCVVYDSAGLKQNSAVDWTFSDTPFIEQSIKPGESSTTTVDVTEWYSFLKPGKYMITCTRDLELANKQGAPRYVNLTLESQVHVEITESTKKWPIINPSLFQPPTPHSGFWEPTDGPVIPTAIKK